MSDEVVFGQNIPVIVGNNCGEVPRSRDSPLQNTETDSESLLPPRRHGSGLAPLHSSMSIDQVTLSFRPSPASNNTDMNRFETFSNFSYTGRFHIPGYVACRSPNDNYQSSTRSYSYRPWLPNVDNCSRQPSYSKRPHSSNYMHPFWRGQRREEWIKRTPIPQRVNNVPVHMHGSLDKKHLKTKSEADFTNQQNAEPTKSPQIDNSKHSKSDLNKYLNHGFTDILKPNSSEIAIDSKTAKLVDKSLSSSTANMLSPLKSETSTLCEPIKLSPSIKYHGDAPLDPQGKFCNADSLKVQDSSLKPKQANSDNADDSNYSQRCDSSLNPSKFELMKLCDTVSTKQHGSFLKHKENKSEKSLGAESSKRDPFRNNNITLPDAKKMKYCEAKVNKPGDFYLKYEQAKLNKLIDSENSKLCDFPLKPPETKSMNPRDTDNAKLTNTSLNPEALSKSYLAKIKMKQCEASSTPSDAKSIRSQYGENTKRQDFSFGTEDVKSKKSLKMTKFHYAPLTNSEAKITIPCSVKIVELDESFLKLEGTKLKNSLESYSRHQAALKPLETDSMKSQATESTRLQDPAARPKEAKSKKSLDTGSSKWHGATLAPSLEKSEKYCGTKRALRRDPSSKPEEAKTKKSLYASSSKCYDGSLQPSVGKSAKFRDSESTKLRYPSSKPAEAKSKKSHGTRRSKCHYASPKPLVEKSVKSWDIKKTQPQNHSSKPKEATWKKSLGDGRSKCHNASLKPSEAKSVNSWNTERTKPRYPSFNPGEAKPKMALDTGSSKFHDTPLKFSEVTSSRFCDNKRTNLRDPSLKPEKSKLKNSLCATSSKLKYANLTPSQSMTVKHWDSEGTSRSTAKLRDPCSKSEEAKIKKCLGTENSKSLYAPLKHSETKSIKLRDAELSKNPSDTSLKCKICDEDTSLKYLDAEMSKYFGTSLKPSGANSCRDCFMRSGHEYIVSSINKLLKIPEAERKHVCSVAPLKRHKHDQKTPLNQKAECSRPTGSDKNISHNEDTVHGRASLEFPLMSYDTKTNNFDTSKTTKLREADNVKSKNTTVKKFASTDSSNHHTAESSLPHRKADPIKTPARETPTTSKNSQHHLTHFISNKHPSSKATKCHREGSSMRSPESKLCRSHGADNLKPNLCESLKPANAESTKGLGSEGMLFHKTEPFNQHISPAMKPVFSQTKKRSSDECLTKPVKCVKYKKRENVRPFSLDPTTVSVKETPEEEITKLREPEYLGVKSPEDYQSKRLTPERYMWTSRLKICGVHLMKQQQCSTSETPVDSDNTKSRISEYSNPPTEFQKNALKKPVKSSKVNRTQHPNDCSMHPESTSFKPVATENPTVSSKPLVPFEADLLKCYETNLKYSNISEPALLPDEYKKLSYSEKNYVSEVNHSGTVPEFSSPICYSPITPPEVGYAGSPSRSDSPGPYDYYPVMNLLKKCYDYGGKLA